jgi:hypothetical protein
VQKGRQGNVIGAQVIGRDGKLHQFGIVKDISLSRLVGR